MKIFILNGPARSGKDSLADFVVSKDNTFVKMKFATPIKRSVKCFFNVSDDEWDIFDNATMLKDFPHKTFLGSSCRQAQIDFSERFIKPVYGSDTFGKILVNDILQELDKNPNINIIISDSGFVEEAIPVIEEFGKENVILVRISRSGYTFENDSRRYLTQSELGLNSYYELENKQLQTFLNEGLTMIDAIKRLT